MFTNSESDVKPLDEVNNRLKKLAIANKRQLTDKGF